MIRGTVAWVFDLAGRFPTLYEEENIIRICKRLPPVYRRSVEMWWGAHPVSPFQLFQSDCIVKPSHWDVAAVNNGRPVRENVPAHHTVSTSLYGAT
jgi:hypothetical protein